MKRRRLPWLVAALAALPFLPALLNGFTDWDDPVFILKNAALANFDVGWMFTATFGGHYHPLTWLSLALDRALWGPVPLGFHLTSILLHAATAALFFLVARRLLGEETPWPALFAALLFAVHPLRVESVAWAIERRDVLSGFFYLLTVVLWLEGKTPQALAAFLASLLSKGTGVTLPIGLALLDGVALGKKLDRAWLKKAAPFAALAVAFGAVGLWAQAANGASLPLSRFPASSRLAVAAYGLCFYPLKTLWPSGLIPLYPLPANPALDDWPFWPCAALLVIAAWALAAAARRRPKLAAGAAFYAVTVAPVLGVFRFGTQLAADRYSYLSCLPFALLAGGALKSALADEKKRQLALAAAASVLVVFSGLTLRQTTFWRSGESLWTRELDVRPDVPLAQHNLADGLMARGLFDAAERRERAALKIDPHYVHSLNGLGLALAAQGRFPEAIPAYEAAINEWPQYWEAWANLGIALARLNRFDESYKAFGKALELNPTRAELHGNYALALLAGGKRDAGLTELQVALTLNPNQQRLQQIYAMVSRAPAKPAATAKKAR